MFSRRGVLLGLAGLPFSLSARFDSKEPLASIEKRVFNAINFQRISGDAEPLLWSDTLTVTARAHSWRMLRGGFFGHEDPLYGNLAARLTAAGINYARSAENVFREKGYDDPVSLAVVEWMYSEGHRINLLTPEYIYTGVGVAESEDGTIVVTQQFLKPQTFRTR